MHSPALQNGPARAAENGPSAMASARGAAAGPENQLVERLPAAERERLLALCEPVSLRLCDCLCAPGQASAYAYFPVRGVLSLVLQVDQHPGLEVGMVGPEGMLGLHPALGVASAALRAVVQGPGTAWRIGVLALRREMARSSALRGGLNRYVLVRMAELATAVACQRFHLIGPRLARRLLMSQDRAHGNQFHVTHDFLANMLGVRRVGVTAAAGALQRSGLIEYHRGELTVLNRPGLEAAACSCYARDRQSYALLMA